MTEPSINVLHVTFNMAIGGTEQVINQLVRHSRSSKVQHQIACIDSFVGEIGQALENEGLTVFCLSRQPGFDLALVKSLRKRIREGRFDIVHCHQYTPYVYGWLASFGTGAKVVFTEHGRFFPDRYRYKALMINPLMALMTPAIIAISGATREALSRYEFIPKAKIEVIYNGIDSLERDEEQVSKIRTDLGISAKAPVLGTVSRLDRVKNQRLMIDAFAKLLETYPAAVLLMVGDGPERSALEKRVAALNIAESVRFTGFINRPAQYLGLMNVFLLSSFTEGTSMTLLEAMSLGIPAVATHVGGNPEIVVDGQTGFLTQNNNKEAFLSAMLRLLEDPGLWRACSRMSKERFNEHYSISQMTNQYLTIYHQCRGN
ncbi:glycosyltransferase [Marinobacter sp. NFXS11]|uniref:glycosyltransferase n=1 Tax=Marinobacter sp. NFXS11 TaxID=2818432 RepID=UPI0032DFCFFD